MFLPVLYAETHYHLKFLYPLYFKKEPEIIFDAPKRVIASIQPNIPILLIVKDADKYPIFIKKIKIKVTSKHQIYKQTFIINKKIKNPWFSQIIYVKPPKKANIILYITVNMEYISNGKTVIINSDNYFLLPKKPFICYYTNETLPFPKDWYAGDIHYHSNYTSDQVEFGADIKSTKIMAMVMGLKWFFVTDHSYDLDDSYSNYLKNDPGLKKWKDMKAETQKLSNANFKIIFGEELSVGNSKNQNIHLLVINSEKFFKGSGDSAENWFKNKPENSIKKIKNKINKKTLLIAAHPFEKIPLIQKITLNRGYWSTKDLGNIKFLQIINGDKDLYTVISKWKKLLLKKNKFLILAGNDAHGNFNYVKQIKIPFIKLFISGDQTFGKWFTVFNYQNNDPINALLKGRIIVTNGPFLSVLLKNKKSKFYIGENAPLGKYNPIIICKSNKEFGKIISIKIFYGVYKTKKEIIVSDKIEQNLYQKGYIRAELLTAKGYKAFTNPIWLV